MKKTKLFGVIALAAAIIFSAVFLASCGFKGGIVQLTNNGTVSALAYVIKYNPDSFVFAAEKVTALANARTIAAGATEKWTFDDDGDYFIYMNAKTKQVSLTGGAVRAFKYSDL